MDKAKLVITDAKNTLDGILRRGEFSVHDISELACMVRDIETLEAYLCEYREDMPEDTDSAVWLLKNIDDELRAAEKYHKWWSRTKDDALKTIGREELKHADQLIAQVRAKPMTPDADARLRDILAWHQALTAKLT